MEYILTSSSPLRDLPISIDPQCIHFRAPQSACILGRVGSLSRLLQLYCRTMEIRRPLLVWRVWIVSGPSCLCLVSSPLTITIVSSTLALATCVIVHPTLLTRIVLTAIFLPIGTLLCLLPIPRYQHTFVRISTSAAGAFGIIISIASFAHILAWSNVWERLWNSNGADWNSGPGKGLSAAYCLLFLSGTACDWFLKRQFGENPDEVGLEISHLARALH